MVRTWEFADSVFFFAPLWQIHAKIKLASKIYEVSPDFRVPIYAFLQIFVKASDFTQKSCHTQVASNISLAYSHSVSAIIACILVGQIVK